MIQAQLIKLRRTPFVWYLILSTIGITAMFFLFNVLYSWKSLPERIQFLFEVYGAFLPLLHGLTVFFLINPEEQMSNMYELLSVKNRIGMFWVLTLIVWGIESIRMALVFIIMSIQMGSVITGAYIILFVVGEIVISLLSIVFHLWLNLKYGVALSMFFATLELLQAVMYSNITIVGYWKYLPTAWSMEWKSDVVNQTLNAQFIFWLNCGLVIAVATIIVTIWFYRWEGRKK